MGSIWNQRIFPLHSDPGYMPILETLLTNTVGSPLVSGLDEQDPLP